MKIVLVSAGWLRMPPEKGGGAEVFCLNLAKQFVRLGHDVTLLDARYAPDDPETEMVEGVPVVRLHYARPAMFGFTLNFLLSQLLFGLKVRRWLKRHDVDVVHVYTVVLGLALDFFMPGLRHKMFYTSLGLRRDKVKTGLADRGAYFMENRLVRRTRRTTIANELIGQKLARQAGVPADRVVMVPIGVDTDFYNPANADADIRERYGLIGRTTVLFVGRICQEKGVEYLIKAAAALTRDGAHPDLRFLVVGPSEQFDPTGEVRSPYLVKIRRLIESLGLRECIRFTGILPVDDLQKLYAACDIVVIPSVVDLDPQVQIEAMASGTPVIGTRVGSMPRRIVDGRSGFIIAPADEHQLAEKIRYYLDNPEKMREMGAFARRHVSEHYSAGIMAEKMLEVFRAGREAAPEKDAAKQA